MTVLLWNFSACVRGLKLWYCVRTSSRTDLRTPRLIGSKNWSAFTRETDQFLTRWRIDTIYAFKFCDHQAWAHNKSWHLITRKDNNRITIIIYNTAQQKLLLLNLEMRLIVLYSLLPIQHRIYSCNIAVISL